MREVNCVKLKKTAEGLERVPYPGELGAKTVSYTHLRAHETV